MKPTQAAPAPRLIYHPTVAASLILVVGALVQVVVRFIDQRLDFLTPIEVSPILAHWPVFQLIRENLVLATGRESEAAQLLMAGSLLLSLASVMIWYAGAFWALGGRIAFWSGLLWVCHPLFFLVAQSPSPFSGLMVFMALAWLSLIGMARTGHLMLAAAAGLFVGLMLAFTLQAFLLAVLILSSLPFCPQPPRLRIGAMIILTAGFMLPVGTGWITLNSYPARHTFLEDLEVDLWEALCQPETSRLAGAARAHLTQSDTADKADPVDFAIQYATAHPDQILVRAGWGLWRSLQSGIDSRFGILVLILQAITIVAAFLGSLRLLLRQHRGFTAITLLAFFASWWLWTALTEPMATALAPANMAIIILAAAALLPVESRSNIRRAGFTRA